MAIPQWLFDEVSREHGFAISHFPKFASAHEGLAIIEEEFEELKREVFVNQSKRANGKLQKEALQLATMSLRFIMDVCCNNKGGNMTEQELGKYIRNLLRDINIGIVFEGEGIAKLKEAFKQAGYVRLAEDQSLPRDFCQDIVDEYHGREDAGSYTRAQQDMLKANFRRVETKEG